MANSIVCQNKWKPIVEPRRAKPKTYRQAPTHCLKFYEEAVIESEARTTVMQLKSKVSRLVPDALALVGPPESNCWFSFASAFQLFVAESSSLFHLCIRLIFMFSEMLHWWFRSPSRGLHKCRVYHGRTKREGCGYVNSIYVPRRPLHTHIHTPSKVFKDRSKAMLLLWFTISVIVCLCMYVLVIFCFILDSCLAIFCSERNCPFGFLLAVFGLWGRCFKCVLLSLWCLGWKMLGNCIDS